MAEWAIVAFMANFITVLKFAMNIEKRLSKIEHKLGID